MGFTLALFVADLAFSDPVMLADARIGVLAASLLAVLLGGTALLLVGRRTAPYAEDDALPRPVDPDRDHVLGPADAPLVLVEYGAYGTEACARFADVVPELRARFGDGPCVVFRHRPDDPLTQDTARAAEAAAAQGRFWAFHDALTRAHPAPDASRRAAAHARLNGRRFEDDRRAAWTRTACTRTPLTCPGSTQTRFRSCSCRAGAAEARATPTPARSPSTPCTPPGGDLGRGRCLPDCYPPRPAAAA